MWFCLIELFWVIALGTAMRLSVFSRINSWFPWLFLLVAIAAAAAGSFCAFGVHWQPSPTLRYLGFPFPAMVWQLENGEWVDYVGTPITAIMDVAVFVAAATLPVLVGSVIHRLCVGKITAESQVTGRRE